MGKVRRQRQKYHAATSKETPQANNTSVNTSHVSPLKISPSENIFSSLDISLDNLKVNLNDDTRSVASFKSVKSELKQSISKKDKLKMRRAMLMQKIDLLNQKKKEEAIRKKRKKNVIIGDTNPLRDALPSIEHLIKSKPGLNPKTKEKGKKRPIAKASKRKKDMIKDVKMFKMLLNNKTLKSDPVNVVKEHVSRMVASGML